MQGEMPTQLATICRHLSLHSSLQMVANWAELSRYIYIHCESSYKVCAWTQWIFWTHTIARAYGEISAAARYYSGDCSKRGRMLRVHTHHPLSVIHTTCMYDVYHLEGVMCVSLKGLFLARTWSADRLRIRFQISWKPGWWNMFSRSGSLLGSAFLSRKLTFLSRKLTFLSYQLTFLSLSTAATRSAPVVCTRTPRVSL
jgi:hypothetical protein